MTNDYLSQPRLAAPKLPVQSSVDLAKLLISIAIINHKLRNPKIVEVQSTTQRPGSSQHVNQYVPGQSRLSVSDPRKSHRRSISASLSRDPLSILSEYQGSNRLLFARFSQSLKSKLEFSLVQGYTFSDPQMIAIVRTFINSLDHRTIATHERDRSLESVLILFIKCSIKVVQKRGGESQDTAAEICAYAECFVKYLIQFVNRSGKAYFSSKRQPLLDQLEKYAKGFSANSRLEPRQTIARPIPSPTSSSFRQRTPSPGITAETYSSIAESPQLAPERSVSRNPNLEISVSTIPIIEYIWKIFSLDSSTLPALPVIIDDLKDVSDAYFWNDLKKAKEGIFNDFHPSYNKASFSNDDSYNDWCAQELSRLDKDIEDLKRMAPYLEKDHQLSTEQLKLSYKYKNIPSQPILSFKIVARNILLSIFTENNSYQNDSPYSGSPIVFDLPKPAKDVVDFVQLYWRLIPESVGVIFISEAYKLYKDGKLSFGNFSNSVLPYISSSYLEGAKKRINSLPILEKDIIYDNISDFYEELMNRSIPKISIVNYESTVKVFESLTFTIGNYIEPFTAIEGKNELCLNDYHEMAIKEQLSSLVGTNFDNQVKLCYPNYLHEFNPNCLYNLINNCSTEITRIKKTFKYPLYDINVRDMMAKIYIWELFLLVQRQVDIIPMDIELVSGVEFDTEQFKELMNLLHALELYYQKLQKGYIPETKCKVLDSYEQFRDSIVQSFLAKFSMEASKLILGTIPSLMNDTFTDVQDDLKITKPLFTAFFLFNSQLSLISTHQWISEETYAEMYLMVMEYITQVIVEYCDFLDLSIKKDLEPVEPTTDDNSDSETENTGYNAKIYSLLSSLSLHENGDAKVHDFSEQTCLKINNLVWMLEKVQAFDIDYDSVSNVLLNYQESFACFDLPKPVHFDIEIKKARNLPGMDKSGYSDPYIKLSIQGEPIGQTRTIYQTLNPDWNQTFRYSQNNQRDMLLLEMSVWDSNRFTKHALMWNGYIEIDPKNFQDFKPHDITVNFGENAKVFITITMEVDKNDDIVFLYNKCVRNIYKAIENALSMMADRYIDVIQYFISRRTIDFFNKPNSRKKSPLAKYYENHICQYQGSDSKGKQVIWDTFSVDEKCLVENLRKEFFADLLTPFVEDFLVPNLRIFRQHMTREADHEMSKRLFSVALDFIISLILPELSERPNKTSPLSQDIIELLHVWIEYLVAVFYNVGNGPAEEDLKAINKYQLLIKLITFDYTKSIETLEDDCNDLIVGMDKQLGKYQINLGQQSAPEFAKRLSVTDLERKSSNIGNSYDEKKEQLEILLRLLRLREDYNFIKDIIVKM